MKTNKKTIAVLAASTLLTGVAFAQTGLTVYGRGNVSTEQQKVGNVSETVLVDNQSRVGVRATRDIAGGLTVGATLEAGINFTNGAHNPSNFFAREAVVSLGGSFGQVKVGRLAASAAYFATADYVSNHNHDTGSSADALYDFIATGSLKNAVAYTSPKLGDLTLEAQYGLKQATGIGGTDSRSVNPMALAANYGMGALNLGLGYERGDNTATVSTTDYANQITARAFYTVGPLGFGGYYQKSSGTNFGRNAYRLSAMYTVGQNEFHANFGAAGNRAGVANTGADQFSLGYNYNLDKQTKVYALYTQINNKSGAAYNPGRLFAGPTAGQDVSSYGVGVRYNF
jgi:predicted porin